MPGPLTVVALGALKEAIQEAIRMADLDSALKLLLESLPNDRPKHRQVVLLQARNTALLDHQINNTLAEDRLTIERNNLTHDVLLFTDHLTLGDYSEKAKDHPKLKSGHLLYQVPETMVTGKNYDCLVRIAHTLSQVLEGLTEEEDITINDIVLSEVMEVEILDPSGTDNPAFQILLLSDGEQVVDEYSYTEWAFNVRPLRTGAHQLVLKVSVLLTVNGKERTKNVVFRRAIEVAAAGSQADNQPAVLRRLVEKAPFSVLEDTLESITEVISPGKVHIPPAYEPPIYPSPPKRDGPGYPSRPDRGDSSSPNTSKRKGANTKWLSIAATILLLLSLGWWMTSFPTKKNVKGPTKTEPVKEPNPLDSLRRRDTLQIIKQ